MRTRQHYGSKAPTQAKAEAALRAMLVMRRSLDGVTVESLTRAYNVKPGRIDEILREESQRRARR